MTNKFKWQRMRYQPCLPLGKDGRAATGSDENIALSRKAAADGMVLLKNEGNLLPLKNKSKVALFGKASVDYVKGGGGSGDVCVRFVKNLCDGMEEKQNDGKITLFSPTVEFYRNYVSKQYNDGCRVGKVPEIEIPADLINEARKNSDVAIISICRHSAEGFDRVETDDYYLSEAEKNLIVAVTDKYEKCVVVLNVGSVIDTSWFKNNKKIQAVLLGWQGGMVGAMAEADILCGNVCPSGHLTDTFASKLSDYPSYENFNASEDYVEYTEDIFVGYRYFETIPEAKEKVNYPFGFGLSYTDFSFENPNCSINDNCINVELTVRNIGNYIGKSVVQLYSSSDSKGIDLPSIELRAFMKTKSLSPKESCKISLSFPISDMAYYDEARAAFILNKSNFTIYIGKNVRDLSEIFTYTNNEETVVSKVKNHCAPKKLSKRLKSNGEYELIKTEDYAEKLDTSGWPESPTFPFLEQIRIDQRGIKPPENCILLDSVADGNATINDFINQLSIDDLIDLLGGCPWKGVSDCGGIGNLELYGVPTMSTADGPAGFRTSPSVGLYATAWPCATLLACTWNPELLTEVGKSGATEVLENNVSIWLTPALNIHRSPLCGRNFEYYSEDPLISGKMAAAAVNGIQSVGIAACVKHFCCNNKEVNRHRSDSIVSERALREIYLKGFEITVKESKPLCLMTAYNKMNGLYTSENAELLEDILRGEWGYEGLIMSDWGNLAENYLEILAGNNVKMNAASKSRIKKALDLKLISRDDLEKNCRYVIDLFLKIV